MERINRVIDWNKVEERLKDYYEVGRREEGADASTVLFPWEYRNQAIEEAGGKKEFQNEN